ncbi:histone H1-like [Clinocottus analis]|uniref:histone H1-like n=1 Tax=Clinocottus analis TaxID=304258 RepID=UPI0035C1FAC2
MAELAPAAAPATQVKSPKKKAPRPGKKSGPGASERIMKAVTASKSRSGVSFVAMKKDLAAGGYDVIQNSAHVKRAVKKLLEKGDLVQVKGTGASGSFKAAKVAEKPKKVAKKPAAKTKKPAAKKIVAAKKPKAAKTTPKKAKKSATPKKTSVKKITKSPKKVAKKAATPKKVTKKVVKPKAAKPAKKTAAKKTVKKTAAKKPAKK